MTYSSIGARRIPYDLDGSTVGYRAEINNANNLTSLFGSGVQTWLTGANLTAINSEARTITIGYTSDYAWPKLGVWVFFPELRTITKMGILFPTGANSSIAESKVQGSADTTNGIDGTWIDATYTLPTSNLTDSDIWRDGVFNVTFSTAVKCVRFGLRNGESTAKMAIHALHLYGTKYAGETADDLLFTDTSGTELTELYDFGDVPEGSTESTSFKIKNASTTKIANNITLTSSDSNLKISWSSSSGWTDTLTIASLGAESLSNTIYTKLTLGVPPLTLGPVAARIYATADSWS